MAMHKAAFAALALMQITGPAAADAAPVQGPWASPLAELHALHRRSNEIVGLSEAGQLIAWHPSNEYRLLETDAEASSYEAAAIIADVAHKLGYVGPYAVAVEDEVFVFFGD